MLNDRQAPQHAASDSTRHTIRLHGPWHYQFETRQGTEAQGTPEDSPKKTIVKPPITWSDLPRSPEDSALALTRNFGCPTNLDQETRVKLVISDLADGAVVSLNEIRLDTTHCSASDAYFDVTNRLEKRNQLRIVFSEASPDQKLSNQVFPAVLFRLAYLEIDSAIQNCDTQSRQDE